MLARRAVASKPQKEERDLCCLEFFFGNAFIIVVVKVVLVDVWQVATRRPPDVGRQDLVEILLDVGLLFLSSFLVSCDVV